MSDADSRAAAISRAEAYFDDGTFQTDLAGLVAIGSESQNPDARAECRRYLVEAMRPRLTASGFTCEIFDNPDPRGGPILLADRIEDPASATVLSYGHGDVIRAQTDQWRDGLHPFRLVEEGNRLYGRGTADNKSQHLVNIAAMEALLATRGRLGFNAKIVIEMSEETGSAGLPAFFEAHKDRLAADVLIASDGPRLQPDTPTMFMGSRGGLSFDLIVECAPRTGQTSELRLTGPGPSEGEGRCRDDTAAIAWSWSARSWRSIMPGRRFMGFPSAMTSAAT